MLWWLVAPHGLRRGEAAGLRWLDVDLERRELTVAHQLVQTDDVLILCEPKSVAGSAVCRCPPEGFVVPGPGRQDRTSSQPPLLMWTLAW
ncbi:MULTISPECIES: hypothetical protein [unclassified Streptosporangium]|uniref:hypothetical protein n=1 Tax=unclassified Streptosporangium TaxID=2632669 RepID=UPI002E2AC72B|nr:MULTISPECIES: hypothetical protein [unclassified Streptosporangium]